MRKNIFTRSIVLATLCCLFVAGTACGADRNIALNRPYTFSPAATYSGTKDAGDAVQLTDGQFGKASCLWLDKAGGVGWVNFYGLDPIVITVDLGKVQPISGVGLSTAAGRSGVQFPMAAYVLVSDDGKNFYPVGDLIRQCIRTGLPDPVGYKKHIYRSRKMPARGRYVRLAIIRIGRYVICDEVEVYAGSPDQKDIPRGAAAPDAKEFFAAERLNMVVKGRLARDLKTIATSAGSSGSYDSLWRAIDEMPPVESIDWRSGLPYNALHRRIWAQNAKLARKRYKTPLLVWSANQWDPLAPLDLPAPSAKFKPIEIHTMNREYRSGAFNITNLSDREVTVDISAASLDGLPIETLKPCRVVYVETQERQVAASALQALSYEINNHWLLRVPAGATKQVWLTSRPLGVKPRAYDCRLKVECRELNYAQQVPVKVVVYPFDFPAKPTLAATAWDYCYPRGEIRNPDTWRNMTAQMREHFITSPWITMRNVCWSGEGPGPWIDKDGNLAGEFYWGRFDEWIRHWPDARYYMMFMLSGVSGHCQGLKLDNPAHQKALGQFFQKVVARFAEHGIPAERVMIHTVDEPGAMGKSEMQARWAKLIKKACPRVVIFNDPYWDDPAKAPPGLYETADVICPLLSKYYSQDGGVKTSAKFYQNLRKRGKTLWGYQCYGPGKSLDPYTYFRLQSWHAFREGMEGIGFWSMGDMRHRLPGLFGAWDDFGLSGTHYAITYYDEKGVTDSKQLEGIREGIEDYEYLVMLQKAIAAAPAGKTAAARALLKRVVEQIGGHYDAGEVWWRGKRDRLSADSARVEILKQLMLLTGAKFAP